MNINDITKWDALRLRFKDNPTEDIFFEFANVCSKHFMQDQPEQWYRFCDGNHTETDFHGQWLNMIMNNGKVAIESAREHHKTSFVLLYILYKMFTEENFSVLYFSAKHGQSKDKLQELEDIYEANEHWLDIEPSKTTWSKSEKEFTNGSNITAEGWGTAVEGAHVQLIVLDDILQEEGTGGMTDEEVWDFYAKIVSPMVTESGKILLIGTKKRQGDIFDKVEDNPEWAHGKFPSTPENPIFPEKWPKERLEAKKREMMGQNFNREFGLEVIVAEDVLMPPSWNDDNKDSTLSYPSDGWKEGMNVLGLDPAVSPTGDYATFFSMSLQEDGRRFVLDMQRHQGLSMQGMIDKIHTLDTRYNYQTIMIEKNAFQSVVVNEAIDTTSLPVQGHETSKTKSDPSEGLPRISVLFENGKYIYPYKTHDDIDKTDTIFKALNSVQYRNGKVVDNHTPDIVMSKYMAEQALMKWEHDTGTLDRPVVRGVKGGL
ncbi:MAG: hypothetical protein ABEH81_01005 [Halopenitus sp.]